ncbi:hypothetical protein [Chloroflexus sp. Y-396-1]|uniref:hypothetical protein n=1 Tax=Chloroflexus sp. Y-396-1 TaxID=867845 RepID=UPI0012EB4FBC|nr:hypothetical protein [Chloroflexus sp. Y-396-1]
MKAYLLEHRHQCFLRFPDSFGSYHTVEKKTVALLHKHIGALNLTGAVTRYWTSMRFLVWVSAVLFAMAHLQLSP